MRAGVLLIAAVLMIGCGQIFGLDDRPAKPTGAVGGSASNGGAAGSAGMAGGSVGGSGGEGGGAGGGNGGCGNVDGSQAYDVIVMRDMPIAYWRLGEPSNGMVALDELQQHDGNYEGAAAPGAPSLIDDPDTAAMIPNQLTDRVLVAHDSALTFAGRNPFTVEAWVKFHDLGDVSTARSVVQKRLTSGTYDGYILYAENNEVGFLRTIDTTNEGPATGPIVTDKTYHLVGTYDGSEACLFVNGSEAACDVSMGNMVDHDAPLQIGGYEFDGVIDEVAIYDHALDPLCIADHHTVGAK